MSETKQQPAPPEPIGPARDFSEFITPEYERRRSTQKDFDAELFEEPVALVMDKLKS
jgi:hypothetical protein